MDLTEKPALADTVSSEARRHPSTLSAVKSDTTNAFEIPGTGGEYTDEFYMQYVVDDYSTGAQNATLKLYYKPSNADCYYWRGGNVSDGANGRLNTSDNGAVKYDASGSGTIQGYISFIISNVTAAHNIAIYLQEDAGKQSTTTANGAAMYFNATGSSNGTSSVGGVFAFTSADDDNTDRVSYTAVNQVSLAPTSGHYDAPFISERGSKFVSSTSTDYIFDMAEQIANARYVLKTAGTESTSNTLKRSLGEGEETELTGGITVKVASITETVGSCIAGAVAGATPDCTVDSSGVSAVIMPNNAASVDRKSVV